MGDWGAGALQNDHAQDLLSIEVERWRRLLDERLGAADTSWDDIQGHLVYVYLLTSTGAGPGDLCLRAQADRGPSSSAEIAGAWKARYLDLWSKTPYSREAARTARYDEIVRLFDQLIALASPHDAPAKKPPRAKKAGAKKT